MSPVDVGSGENRPSDRTLRGLGAQDHLPSPHAGLWLLAHPETHGCSWQGCTGGHLGRPGRAGVGAAGAAPCTRQAGPHHLAAGRLPLGPGPCLAIRLCALAEGLESYAFPCFAPFSQTFNGKNLI